MPFDPSILSEIGGYGPNPVKAQSDAYTLAGQQQDLQMGGIQLGEAKQKQKDEAQVRELLKGAKLDTFEDQTKVAQQITKINPKMGMDFMAQVQRGRAQETEITMEKLQLAEQQSDALVGAIDPIVAQLDQEAAKPGANPAMLDAKAKQLVIPAALQLRQQRPDLAQFIDKFLQDPQGLTYQGLKSADAQSKRGNQAIKERIAQRKQDETERENRARDTREERRTSLAETKEADKKREQEQGIISDDATDMAVNRMLNGEQARDVLANFGRGKQGANNITKVQNRLAATAHERNIPAAELTARMVEMKGLQKEQQTEATIAGKISYAEKEIQQIAPKVLEASAKVPRTNFVPWNRLQLMGESSISDPNVKRLKGYLTTLMNSYDLLAARGGTDVDKRAHNRAMLETADGPEAMKVAVETIVNEAQLSHEAARESMAVDRSRLPGGAPPAAAGAAGAAAPAGGAGETQTYQGKTYRLKPGADRTKRESWEVVGGG